MANKLKNLSVTSVDLVDQGANPDAHIRLFKRAEDEQEPEAGMGMFERFTIWLAKGLKAAMAWEGSPEEADADERADTGGEVRQKNTHIEQETGGGTPQMEQEVTDTMKIDRSRMTPEEQATLAEFEKKYGVADETQPGAADGAQPSPPLAQQPQETGTGLHPDVAKALAEFQELTKRQSAEVEALKKSLEIQKLTAAAQKYEVLGKKAPELAEKLYELKKAGGTVYEDYVALLDENLAALTKSGLFGEIGSSRQGSAGTEQSLGIKAREIQKAAVDGMTTPEAIVKAFEENPELAAQYEAEYRGR